MDNVNVEDVVADMIERGQLKAKIDRPKQLIKFDTANQYNSKLNDWSRSV